ncbi:MAG: iron ABC transporter permease [Bernardetiaceae bacterium]|nr:iron ABC transporter permease [Bernardetiaceae bacterium]
MHFYLKLIVLLLFCLFSFALDLLLGSVWIPWEELFALLKGEGTPTNRLIILDFRLPKALTAVLVGAGLALSGLQMQTLFANPLAGPFVLGVSSGASLGVASWVMGLSYWLGMYYVPDWQLLLTSIAGALAVLFLIMLTAWRLQDNMSLLIVGLMFGSGASALVGILQYFSDAEAIQRYLLWTMGNLGDLTWKKLSLFFPVWLAAVIGSFLLHKPLDALLLGERYAESMGVNINRIRLQIILVSGVLAGAITAFCGPIGFIGLAVPHFAKYFFNTANHRKLLPLVCLLGAGLMLCCDLISQLPFLEQVLPINAVTSLIGAPAVIWIIWNRRGI